MSKSSPITVKDFIEQCGPCIDAIAIAGKHIHLNSDASFFIADDNYLPIGDYVQSPALYDDYFVLRVCQLSFGPGGEHVGIVLIVGDEQAYSLWNTGLKRI